MNELELGVKREETIAASLCGVAGEVLDQLQCGIVLTEKDILKLQDSTFEYSEWKLHDDRTEGAPEDDESGGGLEELADLTAIKIETDGYACKCYTDAN